MKLLKELYSIYSPSNKEDNMIKFLMKFCNECSDTTVEKDNIGNLYITKGKADTYPCIVAHIDQVQKAPCQPIITKDIAYGINLKGNGFEGVGADDKNGIWVALKCLQKYKVLKLAFFVGEEIGNVGSSKARMTFFNDCRFVIECDRKNGKDFIYSINGTQICSEEFIKACELKKFGYEKTSGMMTDILALRQKGLELCCCNISCGYYEPHTDREYTVVSELKNCLAFVSNIIETMTNVYKYKEEKKYGGYFGYGGRSMYDDDDNFYSKPSTNGYGYNSYGGKVFYSNSELHTMIKNLQGHVDTINKTLKEFEDRLSTLEDYTYGGDLPEIRKTAEDIDEFIKQSHEQDK